MLGISVSTRAQNVDFGVTTGIQSTSWGVFDIPNTIGRPGLLFGPHASVFLNERIVVKSGLLLSQEGVWFGDENIDRVPKDDIHALTADYLSIPILAKYYMTRGFHVQAGPRLSYLLVSKAKINGREVRNLKDLGVIKNIDAGILTGLGYEFNSTFTIGINFDFSFVDLVKDRSAFAGYVENEVGWIDSGTFPNDLHAWTWQFTFSYNFTKNRSAF